MDRNHSAFYIFHKKKRKLFNNFLQYIIQKYNILYIYCNEKDKKFYKYSFI